MGAVQKLPEMITAEEIASDMKVSTRHFKEVLSKHPKFPKAIKIGRNREWVLSEYIAWKLKQREN